MTVLYAEDESGIRNGVVDLLELYVDRVFAASDGEEALAYYKLYNPDLLILDICMPKINGLEALKEIRKTDLTTPVIMLTAHTEEEYLLSAVELYITKYLVKPFNKTSLLSALNECIDHSTKKQGNIIKLNDSVSYSFSENTILNGGNKVPLTKKETMFFELLLKRSPNIVRNEELELHVWDDFDVSLAAFKSLLKDLRKKVGSDVILNRQGVGYYIQLD